jgi:hypothetical protein
LEALIRHLEKTDIEGAEERKRSALLATVLCAVHAGGEQGWESGHLEPFLFQRLFAAVLHGTTAARLLLSSAGGANQCFFC